MQKPTDGGQGFDGGHPTETQRTQSQPVLLHVLCGFDVIDPARLLCTDVTWG